MNRQLRGAISLALGADVVGADSLAGGCINNAWRVALADGPDVFVKSHPGGPRHFFEVETDGLAWLADGFEGLAGPEREAVGVPRVLAFRDTSPAFLAVEWIEPSSVRPDGDREAAFGRALAALHQSGAPHIGWGRDGYIGELPQRNDASDSWADFYRTRRLEPLARRAIDAGTLPGSATVAFDRLFARLDDLAGPAEPPARLHGDLWSGNRLVDATGRSWLIDPAPYGGHREIDLAMMRLFGGFGDRAFAAYDEAAPLADGHRERVALYQLYPLLVHVTLFGAGYAAQTLDALRRVVGS